MVVVIFLFGIEMVRFIKLQVKEGEVNTHLSLCHSCIRCLKNFQNSLLHVGQGVKARCQKHHQWSMCSKSHVRTILGGIIIHEGHRKWWPRVGSGRCPLPEVCCQYVFFQIRWSYYGRWFGEMQWVYRNYNGWRWYFCECKVGITCKIESDRLLVN